MNNEEKEEEMKAKLADHAVSFYFDCVVLPFYYVVDYLRRTAKRIKNI